MIITRSLRQCGRLRISVKHAQRCFISTLKDNPNIYIHEQPIRGKTQYVLSYLANEPPNASLALGTASRIPPTPETFAQNDEFLKIVHWVIAENAIDDPDVKGQAAMFASQAGSQLGSGGSLFPHTRNRRGGRQSSAVGDGAGGASSQGGMGGAGRGGYIHVSDQRNPPDFGRTAWPEDIFGSLELDGKGEFVEHRGRYQEAGTYRMCTNEGILGLSPYLRDKVKQKVQELDSQARKAV